MRKKGKNRVRRTFSTAFKKEKVEMLDMGKISVKELSTIYEVSETAIYNWKKLYSKYKSDEPVVIEKISEGRKNIELLKRIAELERIIGKKQMEIDYYKETLEEILETSGEDLKKRILLHV